jgi:hypothetical protein
MQQAARETMPERCSMKNEVGKNFSGLFWVCAYRRNMNKIEQNEPQKQKQSTRKQRRCMTCKQMLPLIKFPTTPRGGFRRMCQACTATKAQRNRSSSHELYLSNLLAKLRYQRSKTHDFTIDKTDLLNLWEVQQGKCAVSGVTLTHHSDGSGVKEFNCSVDRINNLVGYHASNVRLVAYRVNIMKHTLSEDMFVWWIKTIYDNSCQ